MVDLMSSSALVRHLHFVLQLDQLVEPHVMTAFPCPLLKRQAIMAQLHL